jgi:hypothetical protein
MVADIKYQSYHGESADKKEVVFGNSKGAK